MSENAPWRDSPKSRKYLTINVLENDGGLEVKGKGLDFVEQMGILELAKLSLFMKTHRASQIVNLAPEKRDDE